METSYLQKFGTILNKYSPISEDVIKLIAESGSYHSYNKNELIFAEGKYNAFEYFQLDGISHRFNTNEEQQVITTNIYSGGIVITPHFARTPSGRSIFSLQTLTECNYLKVPIGAFDKLREEDEQIGEFGQKVVENEFIKNLNYEVLFRSHSAKDRLIYFRANFPLLENLIPHTVIASFLGITPVSFSRLRNELVKKKE